MKKGTTIYNGQISFDTKNTDFIEEHFGRYFIFLRKELVRLFDFGEYKRTAKYHTPEYVEPIKMKDIGLFNYAHGDNLEFYIHAIDFNQERLFSKLEAYINNLPSNVIRGFAETELIVDVHITKFDGTGFTTQSMKLLHCFIGEEKLSIECMLVDEDPLYRNKYNVLEKTTDIFFVNTYTEVGTRNYMELLKDIHFSESGTGKSGLKYKIKDRQTNLISKTFTELYTECSHQYEAEKLLEYIQNSSKEVEFYSIGEVLKHIKLITPSLAAAMMTNKLI